MEEEKKEFNFKEFEADAIRRLQNGEALEGKDGILGPLLKRLVEAGLNGELDSHLTGAETPNRRNSLATLAEVDLNSARQLRDGVLYKANGNLYTTAQAVKKIPPPCRMYFRLLLFISRALFFLYPWRWARYFSGLRLFSQQLQLRFCFAL